MTRKVGRTNNIQCQEEDELEARKDYWSAQDGMTFLAKFDSHTFNAG